MTPLGNTTDYSYCLPTDSTKKMLLFSDHSLVPEKQWVDGGREEEDAGEVHAGGGNDGHDGADGDGLLCVSQVSGAVGARHDA